MALTDAETADVERIVKRMLGSVSAPIAALQEGVLLSDGHRVLNFQGPGVAVSDDAAARRTNIFIPGGTSGTSSTHVLSALAANTKAKTLWNGTSNDAPPANWWTAAYDDSAWSAAVSNTEAAAYTGIIPGATHLWSSATGTNTAEIVLTRQRFTLPTGVAATSTIRILADSQLYGVYINGNLIGSHADTPWGSPPGSSSTAYTMTVSPSVFVSGTNVIACEAQNNLDPTTGGSVIYDLTLNMNIITALTTAEGLLGGDVTMTTINTYYDGPSASLAAGTWFVNGAVTLTDTTGTANVTAKLWNGTTNYRSGQGFIPAASALIHISLSAIVVLASSSTLRVAAANATRGTTGAIKAAATQNGVGNNASYLSAIQIG